VIAHAFDILGSVAHSASLLGWDTWLYDTISHAVLMCDIMRIATKRQEGRAMTIETTAKAGDRVFTLPNGVERKIPAVPPLENGDRLSRNQFERRYEAMPWLKKAELIEGVVYIGSRVRSELHAEPHAIMVAWAGVYRASTPGVKVADNGTLRLDGDNELLPDDAGVLRSEVFPGLWLDVPALIADNLANLLATLQRGLSSDEHAAFVAQLTAQLSSAGH
jgi:hypothetical protein